MNPSGELNPYAAPSPGSDVPGVGSGVGSIALNPELRALIGKTAMFMVVAGGLQLFASAIGLVRSLISSTSIGWENFVGFGVATVIPVFLLIAGLNLRALAQPSIDDRVILANGLRHLKVALMIKGIAMISVIILVILSVVFAVGMAA